MPLVTVDFDILNGRHIALVYSLPKPSDPTDRWYDRWKTRVLMSYGEALERIGAVPYYCDIDTFIDQISNNKLDSCAAVMSINAGVRPVSHFALVPAVAQWFRKPIIPCTADTIVAGERKDLGNALAVRAGLKLPTEFGHHEFSDAQKQKKLIVKPRDLGGSFGLKLIAGNELNQSDFDGGKIIQEFIPGYDVTIPIFVNAKTDELNVGDATVYIPDQNPPSQWIYDRQAKESYVGGSAVNAITRKQLPLQQAATLAIQEYCKMVGVDCFARVDFRLRLESTDHIECINLGDLAFIEINPMPTVCVGLAFVESIRSWVSRDPESRELFSRMGLSLDDDYDIIAYVLGHSLLCQLGPTKMDNRDKVGS